jgi:ketosteroid isomerase-like protein
MTNSEAAQAIVDLFEDLKPEDLAWLGQYYAPDAYFKDPFNEVRGVPAIQKIFAHMFEQLHEPRFVIADRVVQGQQAFITWRFDFRPKGPATSEVRTIRGATHLLLNEQGRITSHRDYWDAAEELYEKLPVLGALMRWLRRRLSA